MHGDNARRNLPALETARQLALDAFLFLAAEPVRIGKFLNTSGMDAADLRMSAREDRTLVAVLEYLLGDESLLLVFAAHGGHHPGDIQPALLRLQREGDIT